MLTAGSRTPWLTGSLRDSLHERHGCRRTSQEHHHPIASGPKLRRPEAVSPLSTDCSTIRCRELAALDADLSADGPWSNAVAFRVIVAATLSPAAKTRRHCALTWTSCNGRGLQSPGTSDELLIDGKHLGDTRRFCLVPWSAKNIGVGHRLRGAHDPPTLDGGNATEWLRQIRREALEAVT